MFGKKSTRGAPTPLVEAITKHRGDWTVHNQDWGGQTDNTDHEIWVPLNDDACTNCGKNHGAMIRGHELLHTKLSPEVLKPIKVQVGDKTIQVSTANVEVAEEYRINYSLARIEGSSIVADGWCKPAIEPGIHGTMDQGKYTEPIKLAVAGGPGADDYVVTSLIRYRESLGKAAKDAGSDATKEQIAKKQKVTSALIEAIPAYSAAAARIMGADLGGKSLPSWSQVEELAAFLEVNLRDFNRQLRDLLTEQPQDLEAFDKFLAKHGREPVPESNLDPTKEVTKDGVKLTLGEDTSGGPEDVRWAKPHIIGEAKLTESMPAWKIQKANRAVEEGTVPRYMHRWPTDKRVFHRTKRKAGGTLLIDDSGSMGMTGEDLQKILEAAPVATVAVYAGDANYERGGEIRVVARDGKRAKTKDLSIEDYGNNSIDGPALEWLGAQEYPRIWITDGGVTDLNFGFAWQTVEAARRLVIKHKVTMVENAEQAAEVLRTKRFAR